MPVVPSPPSYRSKPALRRGTSRAGRTSPSDERFAEAVHAFAGVAACITIVVGIAVLLGWILDVQTLKSVAPSLVSMKANTAIGFVLAGACLWLVRDENASREHRQDARALASLLAVLAVLTLAEYVFGVDLRIDHLFSDPGARTSSPGRPSPHTALAFAMVGVWLIALTRRRAWLHRVRDTAAVIACVMVLQAVVGYLFGVRYLYGISAVTGMAVHTVGTFVILCSGILAARPRQSFMGLLTSVGGGGTVARRLAPAVVLVPPALGYLSLQVQEHGLYGARAGVSIVAGLTVVMLGAIVIYACRLVDRTDSQRRLLEARLQELSERDPLTNLFNRRRFHEELERQIALAARQGTRVALLMIDLDGLKRINDTHGHLAGDELLLGVATTLTRQLRISDTSARLGGDEFVVILPDASPEGAQTAAAKLVDAMRHSSWNVDGHTIRSTISAGIAITDPHAPPSADFLAQAADRALFRAKADGKDRYAISMLHPVRTTH
jgi:diguanylate cyclase (GGDEF)-like protein